MMMAGCIRLYLNNQMKTQQPSLPKSSLHTLRGVPVILAEDLASFYDTTTSAVNQYRSRNSNRFTSDYAFQLINEEWNSLKSQNVISKTIGRGGARNPPWAYTEHGVAMMSMGMKGSEAVALSKVIIETFVEYRRGSLPNARVIANKHDAKYRRSLQQKIYQQMEQLLNAQLPTKSGSTFGEELGTIATSALGHIKAAMDGSGKRNEKISAEVAKILAEAEKLYAETRKIDAETDSLNMQNFKSRMELLRELRTMAIQLERDDWLDTFDGVFGKLTKITHTD